MKMTIAQREINCNWERLGQGYVVTLHGGDKSHIGSVILATPRKSLTGTGISATSSVMNLPGHMDERIGRPFAEALAAELKVPVTLVCGVHYDHLTPDTIPAVEAACRTLQDLVLEQLKNPVR